ncbi:MAG: bifunctional phosphoribosyl-AMP cyclohydrolase/phosphoribosyl-ATP diphosphatase HisIE [Bacteroidota bacterium]|jgi:phosphoribosyl-ATP pyrophosphohydrolase/phosphoribosyl-AMP cyclohydrolase
MEPQFQKYTDGLMPAIIQDARTRQVLMLGFMNQAAWDQTRATGKVTFFSRSKQRLWTKGEQSGHYLNFLTGELDCDGDTLLIQAHPTGPVCHTGAATCWNMSNTSADFLEELEAIIESRKMADPDTSYVARMFGKGLNKIAQKVGEEAVELVIEAKDDHSDLFINEAADLLFHYLLLLNAKGFKLQTVTEKLRERHIPS